VHKEANFGDDLDHAGWKKVYFDVKIGAKVFEEYEAWFKANIDGGQEP